ncbi:MAG: ArnT family glycosyltransferase, partial [Myxococcaceae bacterium]
SYLFFHESLHLLRPAAALRLPAFFVNALALPALYVMGRKLFGRPAGIFAALCWFLVPRQFFDAHLACFDMPVAAMWLFVVYAFWRAQESPRWWLYTGVVYGLAIATKHNALFIPFVLAPFALWNAFIGTKQSAEGRRILWQILGLYAGLGAGFYLLFVFLGPETFQARMEPISPHAALYLLFLAGNVVLLWRLRDLSVPAFRAAACMAAIAFFGPLIFYGSWPYLWHHPVERTAWYLAFHAQHNQYTWFYMGKLLREPPFPLDYVVVLTALTVPLTLFLPMAIGWISVAVRTVAAKALAVPRTSWAELLLLANGFTSIFLISLPDVPHFGGTKHWYPSMPFLGLLAGAVVLRSSKLLQARLTGYRPKLPAWVGPALLVSVLALPAFVETARMYQYGTSDYSELAGGLPGAATLGMQRQFWSNNVTGVLPWLNQNAPPGARLWLHEVNGFSFRDYQRNGMLRADLQPAGGPQDAQFAVYQYHQEFREHEYSIWDAFGTQKPKTGLYVDETPQIVVYQRR